ncbi:MAG: hypothetical protein P8Y85_06905 [Nitrospirota bacterium]
MVTDFFRRLFAALPRPAFALWLPAAALLVLSAAADSHAASQTRKDIDELQRNMFIMQSDISDLKAEMNKLPSSEDVKLLRKSQAEMLTQMQDLLGEGYDVRNYGVNGRTMLRQPTRWPWADTFTSLLTAMRALPGRKSPGRVQEQRLPEGQGHDVGIHKEIP